MTVKSPVEHDIADQRRAAAEEEEPRAPRRPDLSTFFSTLELVDTSGDRQPQNVNSVPLPQDISAAVRLSPRAVSATHNMTPFAIYA
jgi:hypothetical protein